MIVKHTQKCKELALDFFLFKKVEPASELRQAMTFWLWLWLYWPFQGGTSFVDLLCFCSVLCLLCFVRVCLYVLRGHLLGKGWPLGSRLWCLLWVCHFPIGILGQVWYLIVSIPDLCNLTYFGMTVDPAPHRGNFDDYNFLILLYTCNRMRHVSLLRNVT